MTDEISKEERERIDAAFQARRKLQFEYIEAFHLASAMKSVVEALLEPFCLLINNQVRIKRREKCAVLPDNALASVELAQEHLAAYESQMQVLDSIWNKLTRYDKECFRSPSEV